MLTTNNSCDKIIILFDIISYMGYTDIITNHHLGGTNMYKIGERIVYPMHGAGVIESIEEREILGATRKYYIMRMPIGDMKVMIPLDQVDDIGVRKVIDPVEIENVLALLAADTTLMHQNWNRRYRANMDLIKSGDIYEIADVVRNLTLMDKVKVLSTGERKMLSNARQILISEIVLVKEMTELEASTLIEEAILRQMDADIEVDIEVDIDVDKDKNIDKDKDAVVVDN